MVVTKILDPWLLVEAKVSPEACETVHILYKNSSEDRLGEVGVLVIPGDIECEWMALCYTRPDDTVCGWFDYQDVEAAEPECPASRIKKRSPAPHRAQTTQGRDADMAPAAALRICIEHAIFLFDTSANR